MSFSISSVKNSPFLSTEANEYLTKSFLKVVPSEKLLAELPLPKNLTIRPFFGVKDPCTLLEEILNFNVRSDDVFVSSTPKCGTSWVQIIVWLLTNNLDYEKTKSINREHLIGSFNQTSALEKRVQHLMNDQSKPLNRMAALKIAWNEHFECMQSPRVIKSFFPVYFLPKSVWSKRTKIVYVIRNPKDMAVSEYHFLRNTVQLNLSMDDIVSGITNDRWQICPRSDHILNFWQIRHMPHVFIVTYEDLVMDSFATIKALSEFLECNYTDEQLKQLTHYVSFDNMKNIKTINRENDVEKMEHLLGKKRPDAAFKFLRKGKVGAYHDDLTDDQIKKIDDWAREIETESKFKFKI